MDRRIHVQNTVEFRSLTAWFGRTHQLKSPARTADQVVAETLAQKEYGYYPSTSVVQVLRKNATVKLTCIRSVLPLRPLGQTVQKFLVMDVKCTQLV